MGVTTHSVKFHIGGVKNYTKTEQIPSKKTKSSWIDNFNILDDPITFKSKWNEQIIIINK